MPYIDLKIKYDIFEKHKDHKYKWIGMGEELSLKEKYDIFTCLECHKYFRRFHNTKLR